MPRKTAVQAKAGEDVSVSKMELRSSVHGLLAEKEEGLESLRREHDKALDELHKLLSRKRPHGTAFPSIELADVERDEAFADLATWRRSNDLDIGSSNAGKISLPEIPPPSPPPGVTVFPDEVPDQAEEVEQAAMKEEPAASPLPTTVAAPRRSSSRRTTPAVSATTVPAPEPEAGPSRPHRSATPPITVSMSEVQPRSRRVFSPSLAPTIPDWIPVSNYSVAEAAPATPPHVLMPLGTDYSANLPQLPAVPSRHPHRRKRTHSKGEEANPDLYKLQATYEINPVSSSLARSSKCVLTSDWKIAAAELRHMRAMERIEQKKEQGRWSLRQPKKLKAPPVRKAHWDYLLDEMEWMSLDFAEERRWKIVLAREFAFQIVEWHLSSPEEKALLMVGERGWGARPSGSEAPRRASPGKDREDVEMDGSSAAVDVRGAQQETGAEVLDEMLPRRGTRGRGAAKKRAFDEDEDNADAQALDTPVTVKADSVAAPTRDGTPAQERNASKPDESKVDDADADSEADAEGEIDDGEGSADIVDGVIGLEDIPAERSIDNDADADAEGEADTEEPPAVPAANPESTPRTVRLPNGLLLSGRFKGPEQLSLVRAPLLDAAVTKGVADMPSMATQITMANGPSADDLPLSLQELFPDLAPYAGPVPPDNEHGSRRLEEGHMPNHKPAHTSRIMDLDPMYVSTLQPAKNTIEGDWTLYDGPWWEDPKGSTDMTPEAVASTSTIFHGRGSRIPPFSQSTVPKPSAHHLRPALVWTPEEDECLKKLVSMYPFNWQLIADSFNSEVVTIPTEKRLPYDCFEHWDANFGPDAEKKKAAAAEAAIAAQAAAAAAAATTSSVAATLGSTPLAAPPSSSVPPMTPLTASTSTAQPGSAVPSTIVTDGPSDAPPPPGLSKREAKAAARNKYEGSKKAIRHQALYDSVRRVMRRRETSKPKNNNMGQKQVISIHESHSTYLAMPILDPSTLSNQKHQSDIQRQMQQQQAMQRNQYMQEAHRQRMNQAAQQQQPARPGPPQQQPQQQGQPGPMPPQQAGSNQGQTPRMGPNGQPLPPNMNMNSNQQMILGAVAAATAANRQNGSATPGGTARPPPAQQQPRGPPVQQGQQQVPMQQMQNLEAQMLAAQMMQARAQQAQNQRVASGGTPQPQPGTLTASPYQNLPELGGEGMMPNGVDGSQHMHAQTSPAAMMNNNMHSSPQSQQHARSATLPMTQAPHLRASASGSPQMGNTAPQQQQQQQQQPPPAQQFNQALMAQIVAQITAAGGQPTPDVIRAHMEGYMRNLRAQSQQQQQAQASTPQQQGTPQMGVHGVPHFARSPSVSQVPMRHSPNQ